METHMPYDAPPPFQGRFQDPAYDGPARTMPPPFAGFLPFDRVPALPEAERRNLEDRYDEGILEWDDAFGALLDDLASRKLLATTIVVVLADHGEEFYEHGSFDHGQSLHEELLRVPLAIRVPGIPPARLEFPVCGTDVFSTVLSLAGIGVDAPPFSRDLSRAVRDGAPPPDGPIFAEVVRGLAGAKSVTLGDRKLILAYRGVEARPLAFDLAADPREARPIPDAEWENGHADRLARALEAARATALRPSSRRITAAERESFRGLGYFR
jgi:arylsulfatase A-like enzyme